MRKLLRIIFSKQMSLLFLYPMNPPRALEIICLFYFMRLMVSWVELSKNLASSLLNRMASKRWKRTEASGPTELPPGAGFAPQAPEGCPTWPLSEQVWWLGAPCPTHSWASLSHTLLLMWNLSPREGHILSHIVFTLKISLFLLPHNNPLNIWRQLSYLSLIFPCLD